jgi:c-di-GMP-binding flagellar brake protein YcgR
MPADVKELSIHEEVLVETEISGESVSMRALVTNVLADELWLAPRVPDPNMLLLNPGQDLHLTLIREAAIVVECQFMRRLGDGTRLGMEKSRVFAVTRPKGLESAQRRAHIRVDLERTVRIRSLTAIGTEAIGSGKTVNIGAGGLQFTTDMPLLFGEQLKIALVLTSKDIIVATASVVRIEDGGPPGGPEKKSLAISRVAVRFDKIAETDQERITCHILSAHRRKKTALDATAGAAAP